MIEYEVKRSQRRCCRSDRLLVPGERFYSALVETEDGYARLDFAESEWSEPPEGCIGWWRCQVPDQSPSRVYWAPRDVLLAYFEHLWEQGRDPIALYLMGILLVRRRILKMGPRETDESGSPLMVLESTDGQRQYRIPMVDPDPTRLEEVQQQLVEQLFTDQPPDQLPDQSLDAND